MTIYYLMIEAVPMRSNPERSEFGGAYINCWVKAATRQNAIKRAKVYIAAEKWTFVKTKDIWAAQRQSYIDLPDSLECYDEACKNGLSAIFNTWPIGEDDTN